MNALPRRRHRTKPNTLAATEVPQTKLATAARYPRSYWTAGGTPEGL